MPIVVEMRQGSEGLIDVEPDFSERTLCLFRVLIGVTWMLTINGNVDAICKKGYNQTMKMVMVKHTRMGPHTRKN